MSSSISLRVFWTPWPRRYNSGEKEFDNKPNEFNSTDDGEASEKSHGASNETQLGLNLDLFVSLDLVKGGRVKVDMDQLQS